MYIINKNKKNIKINNKIYKILNKILSKVK